MNFRYGVIMDVGMAFLLVYSLVFVLVQWGTVIVSTGLFNILITVLLLCFCAVIGFCRLQLLMLWLSIFLQLQHTQLIWVLSS